MFIARFIVMQPTFWHSELHIWFSLHFLVDYEHIVLTIIGDPILLYEVAQSYDVGDGSLDEPNIFVIARHFPLWVNTMVPPLLLSFMLLLDLYVSDNSAWLQKKSIVY